MDWSVVKAEALEAGERAVLHRYAMDEAENPEPMGVVHLAVQDAHAAAALAAGEAERRGDLVQLVATWEKRAALSYAYAWSKAVAGVLEAHGLTCRLVEDRDRSRCDDGSLRRGLAQLVHLGAITVRGEAGRPGRVWLSQHRGGPVVLEIPAEEAGDAAAVVAAAEASRLEIQHHQGAVRVRLGSTADEVAPRVIEALTVLGGERPLVLLASPASRSFPPW